MDFIKIDRKFLTVLEGLPLKKSPFFPLLPYHRSQILPGGGDLRIGLPD